MDILPKTSGNNIVSNPSHATDSGKDENKKGFTLAKMPDLKLPRFKREIREAKWPMILCVVLLALVLLIWLGLFVYNKSLDGQVKNLESKLQDLKKEENREMAKKIKDLESSLEITKTLLNSHLYTSQVFEFIEKLVLPNVQFADFNLNSKNSQVSLTGSAQTYNTLARQMLIFQQEKEVKEVKVSGISLDQLGGIKFSMQMTFYEKMLNK